jgi:rhamnopyranosyl-N-acetylglucosaminyl-diphospho-decaprenol beta-1,3/1,4-galactofuranosyltransferase
MRVLAHIHTFNAADVIDQALDAIQRQTRPPDAILIVDNGSTDGTLNRMFPEQVTVIRNPANLGVIGSIRVGIAHALGHGFDWIWILDADGVPEPRALERLLELYDCWPQSLRDETGFIACLPRAEPDGVPLHGYLFTRHGRFLVTPAPEQRYYPCHLTIWSGCLYRLAAVHRIGLPNGDYFIDRGEVEYGYRMMKAGYKSFIHQDAEIRQHVSIFSLSKRLKLGPLTLTFYELPPLRCYYTVRNTLYFALYDQADGRWSALRELWRVRSRPGRGPLSGIAWQAGLFTLNFALRPRNHGEQIRACLRGIWHGVTGNMTARY